MAVKSKIIGPKNKISAYVNNDNGNEDNALVVATRPLKTFNTSILFLSNDIYGYDINQDATFGGVPIEIHDGTDNTYWTGSNIVGSFIFDSVSQAHTGTKGIDAHLTINGDIAQIAKGAAQDLTGYVAITGWIYISIWGATGTKEILIYGWDTGTSTQIGISVDISDYIDIGLLDTWQKFVIYLSDMNLTGETIDAVRIEIVNTGGAAADFYLDDIQIEETGGETWKLEVPINKWLYIDTVQFTIVDAYAGTVADGTMPCIPYNSFLGVAALTSGFDLKLYKDGEITYSCVFKKIIDLLSYPCINVKGYGNDGTNTWVILSLQFPEPILLKHSEDDKITLSISEDLSGLLYCRVGVGGYLEQR